MSATSVTMRGRAAAERLMVDACTITRAGTLTTSDTTAVVSSTPTTVYAGKCRVQQQVPVAKPAEVGQAAVWLQRLVLQVPMSAVGVRSDDLVTITASVLDPDLAGRVFHIRELGHKTHMTSRRLQIEEITS
jgi:hypothetical protein